jgi:ABC-type nitrate/sulfonate/bicarbonate transport system ATPase subunit
MQLIDRDSEMTVLRQEMPREVAASIQITKKEFVVDSQAKLILANLQFEVREGEFLAILGPSGCGKTTLLRLIAGLDTSYDGKIVVHGQAVEHPGRNRGLMFQESRLLPWMTVRKNIEFALGSGLSKEERHNLVSAVLKLVRLDGSEDAWPLQLSGGMAKRVALARALINVPSLLLLDEPFAALDSPTKYNLQAEVARICTDKGITTLLVTHDIEEAVYLSDRILILPARPGPPLEEMVLALPRPRNRTSSLFQDACSALTKTVFHLWWKTSLQEGQLPPDP